MLKNMSIQVYKIMSGKGAKTGASWWSIDIDIYFPQAGSQKHICIYSKLEGTELILYCYNYCWNIIIFYYTLIKFLLLELKNHETQTDCI